MAEKLRHIKMVVQYDGTDFAGFQRQRNRPTIQSELEKALRTCLKHDTSVMGAGRTDAGVHAEGQVCKFSTTCRIPSDRIPYALNRLLPHAIVVRSARDVHAKFHPRYDATSRVYRYTIDNEPIPLGLMRRYACHVREPLDTVVMHQAAKSLMGTHDFASFQSSGSEMGGTIRHMFEAACHRRGSIVTITLEANAFLYQMVRAIVGTLIEIGTDKRDGNDMRSIMKARRREAAGPTAPPHGLCLVKVKYRGRLHRQDR